MKAAALASLVGDLRQLASVRRIVLDDGPERGVRALLFSTGGGFDFLVLADRAMDIGTLNYRGVPLAWQSPSGFRSPALSGSDSDNGRGFNRAFSGLLMTCGLDHSRQPVGGAPLHGRLPLTPARLTSYGEDWDRDEPTLFCTGEVIQASYGQESLRLRRRIEAPVGGTSLTIIDEVENCGGEAWPHALLYHMNFGFPAIRSGTAIALNGQPVAGPLALGANEAMPQVACMPSGPPREAICEVTTPSEGGSLRIAVAFGSETLPFFQLWHDLRPRAGVLAIEPCTSDRGPDGTSVGDDHLQPGERRGYRLKLSVAGNPPGPESWMRVPAR